jgi:SAM-dependent methyltransferase
MIDKEIVNQSSHFYNDTILEIDIILSEYNLKTFLPFFKGKKALELGPATGYMTKHLVKSFDELHLVEGAKNLLEQIPDYPNVKKYHAFFEEFETNEKFDTIIMSHVLEHIADPGLVLAKIYDWLEDDGVFLVSVPNAKSIHRMVAVEMGILKNIYTLNDRDKELGHFRVYDMALLQNHLQAANFKVSETGGIFLKPLSNQQMQDSWTKQMIEGFFKVGKHFKENCAEIFAVCKK